MKQFAMTARKLAYARSARIKYWQWDINCREY